jgi:spermidine/putrescine transport system substrate-binding protein
LVSEHLLRGHAGSYRRRDVLTLAGLAAAGLAGASCGTESSPPPARARPASPAARFWARQRRHGRVDFANWPLYIDAGHRTLTEFTATTGISVSYTEVIQDTPSWFAKINPILLAGESIGYDVMVITDGFQFSQLLAEGELLPLDQARLGSFYQNASAKFKRRSFDPGNTYSVPWASGSTGIAWNPKYIKTPVTSISELWNPAYQGRVGMMSDLQEIGNFAMIKLGINPERSAPADWRAAGKVLAAQRRAGLIRSYYQQSYIDALSRGDTWISMAWSGDIFQQNLTSGTGLKFVIPREGGSIWTDNMVIPRGAQNPVDAMMLMDWYYRPPIAAQLTAGINYITAVPAVRPIIAADAAKARGTARHTLTEVATSKLVWPTPAEYARLYNYTDVSGKPQREYTAIFQSAIGG